MFTRVLLLFFIFFLVFSIRREASKDCNQTNTEPKLLDFNILKKRRDEEVNTLRYLDF